MGGTSSDAARSVAVDGSGNVYTVGTFSSTADFDPGPGTFNLTSASLMNDVFVSKLDSNGSFLWARRMGGTSSDRSNGVAVDAAGNVCSVGAFKDTADFDPGPGIFSLTSAGSSDVFVSKLDGNGSFLWAIRMGGASDEEARSVAVDAGGNIYSVGLFSGTADFDPGPGIFNLTSAGSYDVFVSKLDSNGNFLWAKQMGGTTFETANGVAVDGSGKVHSIGFFLSELWTLIPALASSTSPRREGKTCSSPCSTATGASSGRDAWVGRHRVPPAVA